MKALSIVTLSSLLSLSPTAYSATDTMPTTDEQFEIMQSAMTQVSSNLSEEDFIREIEKKYLATHRFLEKLSRSQRSEVYSYYLSETDFTLIRGKIFDIFFRI